MKITKIFLALFFCATIGVILIACNVNSISTPPQILAVEVNRSEQISSTPLTIQMTQDVTRDISLVRTVEMTLTPETLLAKDCFDRAMNQVAMNSCANEEYQLAMKELDKTVAQIKISGKDMQELEQIQSTWQKQMEYECDFFTSRTIIDENGNSHYIDGSMAPMNRGFCMADRTKERIIELHLYFLDSPNSNQ